jgi:hypothetical protein
MCLHMENEFLGIINVLKHFYVKTLNLPHPPPHPPPQSFQQKKFFFALPEGFEPSISRLTVGRLNQLGHGSEWYHLTSDPTTNIPRGARTLDRPLIRRVLYQLSYRNYGVTSRVRTYADKASNRT